MTIRFLKVAFIASICMSNIAPVAAQRAIPRRSPAAFASVDDLVRSVSCSVAQFAIDAKRAGQPVKAIKGQVTVKLGEVTNRATGISADLPLIPISSSLGATGTRTGSVTRTWDVGLVPGQPVPPVCATKTIRIFDGRGRPAGAASIEPLFTARDLVTPGSGGCINTTTVTVADGFAVEKKAGVGLKIDLKVIKINLASGDVAAKRETSYSIEFTFDTPRTNKCGFLRPAPKT